MLIRQYTMAVILSVSAFAIEWEYKTENKEKTLSIMKEVNSFVNNMEVKKRYYRDESSNEACEPGYVANGSYCEVKEELKYDVVGNVILLDHDGVDDTLNIRLVDRGNPNATPPVAPSIINSVTAHLLQDDVQEFGPFIAGGLVCNEDIRLYEDYANALDESTADFNSQPQAVKDASGSMFSYFIVDMPTNTSAEIDQETQMVDILENKFKCEHYGNLDDPTQRAKILERIAGEVQVKREDYPVDLDQSMLTADQQNTPEMVNMMGLSHIPLVVEDIQENGEIVKTYFPDKLSDTSAGPQEPSVIKFHPVKLSLSKTFYVPEGSISKNFFSTNYNTGITELTTYETTYQSFPSDVVQYAQRKGDVVAYPTLAECQAAMVGADKRENVVDKKNIKTKYKMMVNYGNILTEYNTTQPLDLFDPIKLQRYIVEEYGLNGGAYDEFSQKIPYALEIERSSANTSIPPGEVKKKEEVYPKVMPVIKSVEKSSECGDIGSTYISDKFAEAELQLVNESNGNIEKTKYIGLVNMETMTALKNSTEESDDIIRVLKSNFKNRIARYGSQIKNYINYDFERTGSTFGEVSLAAPIVIDFYRYQADVFKQFVDGSTLERLKYNRKIRYAPVKVALKFHKCDSN